MVFTDVHLALANLSFHSVSEYIALWDSILEGASLEEVLSYKRDIMQNLHRFCGFVIMQIAENTNSPIAQNASRLEELFTSVKHLDYSASEDAFELWTTSIRTIDRARADDKMLAAFERKDFVQLVMDMAVFAQTMTGLILQLEG